MTTGHIDPGHVEPGRIEPGQIGDTIQAAEQAGIGDHEHHGPHSDRQYVMIALILALITGAEVAASYIDLGPAFLPLLLIMMVVKFFMVVLWFMHLKFDSKWFSFFFYAGLVLAVGCYLAFLATFEFFGSR